MNLEQISEKLQTIIDGYGARFGIERGADWYMMKLQEELGELTAAHLQLTRRGRPKGRSAEEIARNLQEEVADVLAMTLLFARHQGIDAEKALAEKWFKFLSARGPADR